MAIEIDTIGDSSVKLEGEDARRFIEEVKNPSNDPRRIQHLERSAKTFERAFSEKSANELLREFRA